MIAVYKRKITFLFVLLVGLWAANLGFAQTMTYAELAIGKIQVGNTFQQVVAVMGQPTNMTNDVFAEGIQLARYYYGDKLEIIGRGFLPEVSVEKLKVTGFRCQNKDYATPGGIAVGTAYSKVVNKFGAGTKLDLAYVDKPLIGCTYYAYEISQTGRQMVLAVDGEGIIQLIEVNTEL